MTKFGLETTTQAQLKLQSKHDLLNVNFYEKVISALNMSKTQILPYILFLYNMRRS